MESERHAVVERRHRTRRLESSRSASGAKEAVIAHRDAIFSYRQFESCDVIFARKNTLGARKTVRLLQNKKMRPTEERGEKIKPQRQKLWQKRRSPINGVGLFAALPIRTATPIIEFKGRIIPWDEGAIMLLRGANHVIKFDANHDMDARPQWSPAGHVNHGCYPNCAIKKKQGGLWLTSIRPIEQGEELLIDYNYDLGEEFGSCKCGHPRCRGLMLRSKDWPKLRRLTSKILRD